MGAAFSAERFCIIGMGMGSSNRSVPKTGSVRAKALTYGMTESNCSERAIECSRLKKFDNARRPSSEFLENGCMS